MWVTLKVVLLTCSVSACEYSWSIEGWIHSKWRNRLGQMFETGQLPWDIEKEKKKSMVFGILSSGRPLRVGTRKRG